MQFEQRNNIRNRSGGHAPGGSDFCGDALGLVGVGHGKVFQQQTWNVWSRNLLCGITARGQVVRNVSKCSSASSVSDASPPQRSEETSMSVQERELEKAHGHAENFAEAGDGRVAGSSLPGLELTEGRRRQRGSFRDLCLAGPGEVTRKAEPRREEGALAHRPGSKGPRSGVDRVETPRLAWQVEPESRTNIC